MIEPEDFVERLGRRKPHWFHGKPEIFLEGREKRFGKISFDFKDEIVSYKIWILDKEKIISAATTAVYNFVKIWQDNH